MSTKKFKFITTPQTVNLPGSKTMRTMKIEQTCNCDKYSTRSTRGVIDLNCKNCGGSQPQTKIR